MVRLITCASGVVVAAVLSFEITLLGGTEINGEIAGRLFGRQAPPRRFPAAIASEASGPSLRPTCKSRVIFFAIFHPRRGVENQGRRDRRLPGFPERPAVLMLGRANAAANSTIAAQRSNNNSKMPQPKLPAIGLLALLEESDRQGRSAASAPAASPRCKMIGTAINAASGENERR